MINKEKNFYFPKLDGLRFIALLLVFLHHFTALYVYKPLMSLGVRGWFGVELFFVLSSFLLTKLLLEEWNKNKKIGVKNFYLRRILRIWPLYFLYLLAMIFMSMPKEINSQEVLRLVGTITFTDNIFTSIFNYNLSFPFISHLWTISIEEQYYIFLPFLIPILIRLSKRKLAIVASSCFLLFFLIRVICVFCEAKHPVIWVLPIQGDAFLFGTFYGLGFFDTLLTKINSFLKIAIGMILIGITFAFPNIDVLGYSQIITYTFLAIGFVFIVDGVLNSKNKLYDIVFGNRIARYLGKITYGLYIYHLIAIYYGNLLFTKLQLTKYPNSPLSWSLRFFITLALLIIVSSISYQLIEKPFLKLKKRFSEVNSRPI